MNADTAVALIRAQFPDYPIKTVEAMGHQGWGGDSDVFTLNGRDIFRFPRSVEVREKLGIELRLLPQLEPHLPLAIPHFTHVVVDPGGGPPLFVAYPRIEGLQLTSESFWALETRTQSAFARQIGEFIGALHRFPVETAQAAGVQFVGDARASLAAYYGRVQQRVFPLLQRAEQARVDALFEPLFADPAGLAFEPVLCHKDLSGDHILFDPDRLTLTGVIDFGDCRIMDPMIDFAGLVNEYGAAFCEQALAAADYELDERARRRHHFYARRGPLVQLLYGVEQDLPDDIEEGRQRLGGRREA